MRLPFLHKSPALQPSELSDVTARAVDELLREGESQNTLASYRSALRYWAAWFGIRYGSQIQLPLPSPCVLQFIVDHAQRTTDKGLTHDLPSAIDQALVAGRFKGKPGPMALNTLAHRIAVLSKAHQLREAKNPCQDPKVRQLLAMTRRAYAKRGALPHKKDALTRDPLQAVLATCDDSLQGKRDRALLLFAWASGGRRRSEVAAADLKLLSALARMSSPTTWPIRRRTRAAGTGPTTASPWPARQPRPCRHGWTPPGLPRARSSGACCAAAMSGSRSPPPPCARSSRSDPPQPVWRASSRLIPCAAAS